jgi:excisionase family DNA binding protein
MEGVDLTGANLEGADLSRTILDGAGLEEAVLDLASLENASLADANLGKAQLVGVNLRCADLEGAYLGGANLAEADLRKTTLADTNLEEAELCGADLRGCDLSRVLMDRTNLDRAKVFGMELPRESLMFARVDAWDISRAGDASLWEEGPRVGAFLSRAGEAEAERPAPLFAATRVLGPEELIKDSELLVKAESVVEIQGRVENCQIVLGEDVELKIAPTGLLQGCRIVGRGFVRGAAHRVDELPAGTAPTENEFDRPAPSPTGHPIGGTIRRSPSDGSPQGAHPRTERHDLPPRANSEVAQVEKMLSVRQAAEMMNVHTGTLHRWIRAGRLKAAKPGRHWRIPESSLRELIEKGNREPGPSARHAVPSRPATG